MEYLLRLQDSSIIVTLTWALVDEPMFDATQMVTGERTMAIVRHVALRMLLVMKTNTRPAGGWQLSFLLAML